MTRVVWKRQREVVGMGCTVGGARVANEACLPKELDDGCFQDCIGPRTRCLGLRMDKAQATACAFCFGLGAQDIAPVAKASIPPEKNGPRAREAMMLTLLLHNLHSPTPHTHTEPWRRPHRT